MARVRTLAEIRSDVRIAADCVNQTTRHPNSQLNRWINESIQRLREKVSLSGNWFFVDTMTGSVSAGNPVMNLSLPSPVGIVRILGVDCDYQGRTFSLTGIQSEERNDWGGIDATNAQSGIPEAYWYVEEDTIAVLPVPDGAYDFLIYYLPAHEDLVADGDEFNGIAGWEDWVRSDVCLKIATRDRNTELFQMASVGLAAVEESILAVTPRMQKPGPVRRLDTRGRREGVTWRERRWPQP